MTHKVLTWVLMVALLVGQSYAYALVPCESQPIASYQHNHDMQAMDHSEHSMTSEQTQPMPCCDQECNCPPGTCASVAISQVFNSHPLNLVSQASALYLLSIQDTYLASLRKPPIFS